MIRRFRKMFFELKPKMQLDIAPRHYAPEYDSRKVTDLEAKVFARTAARSPKNIQLLMKAYRVESIEALLAVLPSRKRSVNPRDRFRRWLLRVFGQVSYEPVVRPVLRRLSQEGRLPIGTTLIRRTDWNDAPLVKEHYSKSE